MKKYYFNLPDLEFSHAGTKATSDANKIFEDSGYIPVLPGQSKEIATGYDKLYWLNELKAIFLIIIYSWKIGKNSQVVLNYPPIRVSEIFLCYWMILLKSLKHLNVILLVHDIPEIRGVFTHFIERHSRFYHVNTMKKYDALIVHGENMKQWLLERGFQENRLFILEIFDYLAEVTFEQGNYGKEIVIAGNLRSDKNQYLPKINQLNTLKFNLYGVGLDEQIEKYSNVSYFGSFPSDKIASTVQGSYGLVWDSESFVGGKGTFGIYQHYNSPHKASLYLISGLPIIIWSDASLAQVVIKYNLGVVVDNLSELPQKLAELSEEEYTKIRQSVLDFGEKISQGYFLKKVLQEINSTK